MVLWPQLAAVWPRDRMAVYAAVARKHRSAQIELRSPRQRILVALATAGLDVAHRQYRFFACAFTPVGFRHGGGLPLPTMTDHAPEPVDRMWNNRVLAEGLLRDVSEARLLQTQVASRAAIDHSQLRHPDLMNAWLEAPAQTDRIPAISDQARYLR